MAKSELSKQEEGLFVFLHETLQNSGLSQQAIDRAIESIDELREIAYDRGHEDGYEKCLFYMT